MRCRRIIFHQRTGPPLIADVTAVIELYSPSTKILDDFLPCDNRDIRRLCVPR